MMSTHQCHIKLVKSFLSTIQETKYHSFARETDLPREAEIFVAVLGASDRIYAEASKSQQSTLLD